MLIISLVVAASLAHLSLAQNPSASPTAAPSPAASVTSPPSLTPVTSSPSASPVTFSPSASPVTSPPSVSPVTPIPSASPVSSTPTVSPVTTSPSVYPVTPTPSASLVSSTPTVSPVTTSPSVSPITSTPSASPVSSTPTVSPVTTSPSASPVTSSPSVSTVTSTPSALQSNKPSISTSPSSFLTEVPTKLPTANPTELSTEVSTPLPTVNPTELPTEVPTKLPTANPTELPTEVLTTLSTANPTELPTDVPTALPTANPTELPTDVPTALPTANPTELPTEVPIALPTANPTGLPTEVPTSFPTSIVDFPTEIPTATLTSFPSESPTNAISAPTRIGSGLFFPNDFTGEGGPDVCIIDNGEFDLPSATPMFTTLEECCRGFYAWNFNECIGNIPTFKFYPNWLRAGGSRDVCLFDDGSNEVPSGTPKYDTPQECCTIHYSWNLDVCNSVEPGPSNKYFPNWNGNNEYYVCLLDDGTRIVPESAPLYADLSSCCDFNYSWNLAQCYAADGPSGKFYPNLDGDNFLCFQDVDAGAETLPFGAPVYDDRSSCCEAQFPWARDECINHLV